VLKLFNLSTKPSSTKVVFVCLFGFWGFTSGVITCLVFTRMPGMSYRRRLSSLLCLCDLFGALSISTDPLIIVFKGPLFTTLILAILPLFCDPFSCCYCCCCCSWWWCYWSAHSNSHHGHVCIREFCMTCSAPIRASPASVLSVSCSYSPPCGPLWTGTMLHDLSQLSTMWSSVDWHNVPWSQSAVHHVVLCGLAQCSLISVSVSC